MNAAFGFGSLRERDFFVLFTTVKGIGNRKALRALASSPGEIARFIAARDLKSLTQLPEIGKRMAETVVAELHGKVDAFLSTEEVAQLDRASEVRIESRAALDAIAALVTLGESESDAQRLVAKANSERPEADADDLLAAVLRTR